MKGPGCCLPWEAIAGTQHYTCQQKFCLWELHDEAGENLMGGFGVVLGSTKSRQTKVFCCALVLLFSLLSLILLCNFCSFYLSQQGEATGISFSLVSSCQTSEIPMPLQLWPCGGLLKSPLAGFWWSIALALPMLLAAALCTQETWKGCHLLLCQRCGTTVCKGN